MSNMYAYLDDFGAVTIHISRTFYNGKSDVFYLTGPGGTSVEMIIGSIEDYGNVVKYSLKAPAGIEFGKRYRVREQHGLSTPLVFRMIVNTKQFEERFAYTGNDLGSDYHRTHTDFAVWAPTAVSIILKILQNGRVLTYSMNRTDRGVWRISVPGNLKNAMYTYLVERNGEIVESVDPYAYSSSGNSAMSAVIDTSEITKIRDYPLQGHITGTDAIIYETSVRDMTSSPLTGTSSHGKFMALTEEGTRYKELPTGLSYIASLGVTHVQLQPCMDFATVDEFHPEKNYNWGYDPMHYLVPEGSYSSDPDDPYSRVREMKMMICAMHRNNLRVVLDVVFNHMYNVEMSGFDGTVPYYYFRYNSQAHLSNGTFCGNDFASEKIMARKHILFCIRKLMELYNVDGFRFDLMGILDIKTMNEIRKLAISLNPDVMIYGEGWDMPTILPSEEKASMNNQSQMPGIGHFNDFYRDTIKGKTADDQKYARGYVTGDLDLSFAMLSALCGTTLGDPYYRRFESPVQSINGIETHDNATAWDKMHFCCGNEDRATRQKRQRMLLAVTMFSQGIPFLHSGMEFCATKNDNHNSYNAGDEINRIDWQRANINKQIVEFTKKAIALRKKYRNFRLKTTKEIESRVHLSIAEGGVVFYSITNTEPEDEANLIRVMINPTMEDKIYNFEPGWKIIFDENGNAKEGKYSELSVPALSCIVAVK